MWLPRDERGVLRYLCTNIGRDGVGHKSRLQLDEFGKICGDEHSTVSATRVLNERGLVMLGDTDRRQANRSIYVGLTPAGYDLGRKYNSRFARSGLWFSEYKDHWVWLIVSFIGGVLGSLLVQWLSRSQPS